MKIKLNKYKIFAVLAAVTVLFVSCNNANQYKPDNSEEKVLVSFGVEASENSNPYRKISDVQKINASPISLTDDITKFVLKAQKKDSSGSYVSYWTDKTYTSLSQLTAATFELNLGFYNFTLELYHENALYQKATLSAFEVTSSTNKITFKTQDAGTGALNIEFKWEADFEKNPSIMGYTIEAALYESLTATESYGSSAQTLDMTDAYQEAYSNFTGDEEDPVYISKDYLVENLPAGNYFLKYKLYVKLNSEESGEDPISILLNPVGPIPVSVNAKTAHETIQIDLEDINALPDFKGAFELLSTKIDIEAVPDEDLWLNKGTITFRVKDHDSNSFIHESNITPMLFYANQQVDDSYYDVAVHSSGDNPQDPDYDYYFEFTINGNKPLLTGGNYQLYILAKEQINGFTIFGSKTIDIYITGVEYHEFNINGKTPEEIQEIIASAFVGLRNDVYITLIGSAKESETPGQYLTGYFTAISDVLNATVKKNYIDLDLKGVQNFTVLDQTDCLDCDNIRSLILPATTYTIGANSIKSESLSYLEIWEDGEATRTIEEQAFSGARNIVQFVLSKTSPEVQSEYFILNNDQVLLKKTGTATATILDTVLTPDDIDLSKDNGGYTITRIGEYAFADAYFATLEGLESVESIGTGAFEGADINSISGLTQITEIPDYAFYKVKSTTITGLSNVTSLGKEAFYGAKITTLSALDKVTSAVTVGSSGVFEQVEISEVSLASLETVDKYTFQNSKIQTINLPKAKTIGREAFNYAEVGSVTLDSIQSIGYQAFYQAKLTEFPEIDPTKLVEVDSNPGIDELAFASCEIDTITVKSDFLNFIKSDKIAYNAFNSSKVQNLVVDIDFEPIWDSTADSGKGGYSTTDGWDQIHDKLNIFVIQDTLTFNRKVTLPDLTTSNNYLGDVQNKRFFKGSEGSYGEQGLKNVVFKQKSYIGQGQFSEFMYLESIIFEDENNEGASEIGRQAFWKRYGLHESCKRTADKIVLNGVIRIGFNAINNIEGGTLTFPDTLIAVNSEAFRGVSTTGEYAVSPVLNFPAGGEGSMWVKVSSINTNYGNPEQKIKEWIQEKPSTITAQDGVEGTSNDTAVPKIEVNQPEPTFEQISLNGTGDFDKKVWYYHLIIQGD